MSNPNPLFQELSSDPGQIAAVNQAGDLACRTLQNIGQLEVDREIIARGILQAAGSGERDANKLCERAIYGPDRAGLSAAWRLKQPPDRLVQVRRPRHKIGRKAEKALLTSGVSLLPRKTFREHMLIDSPIIEQPGPLDFAC